MAMGSDISSGGDFGALGERACTTFLVKDRLSCGGCEAGVEAAGAGAWLWEGLRLASPDWAVLAAGLAAAEGLC